MPGAQAEVHAKMLGQVIGACAAVPVDPTALKVAQASQLSLTETRLLAEIRIVEATLTSRLEVLDSPLRSEMAILKWINGLTLALLLGLYLRP